uniref:NADH-ubiquinone oxidoreductase chain 3 n=1 Tax=Glossotermes oculatus TaxID=280691 RepID=A0A0A7EAF3_9NEOP|nr:NADH dehydrogenase subunit 3 [Glossotermes oculatus]URH16508.1 NADH dehydrogenase subunit 3 [Glossotermes oculatus]
MTIMMTAMTVAAVLSLTMMMMATLISKKSNEDREKSSPFECGFDPKNSARLPFSSRFFIIAVIFMIFDVEIALLLPMPITMTTSDTKEWMITSTTFLVILIVGLYHEWNQGALEWST